MVGIKKENGATGCPILLVFTLEYRILYLKEIGSREKM